MSALFPLAVLTLFASASLTGPAAALLRAIRRVVQPTPPEVAPEDDADGVSTRSTPLLRVLTTPFTSLRFPPPLRLLPVFQDNPVIHGAAPIPIIDDGTTLGNGQDAEIEVNSGYVAAEVEELATDATAIGTAPPPYRHTPSDDVPKDDAAEASRRLAPLLRVVAALFRSLRLPLPVRALPVFDDARGAPVSIVRSENVEDPKIEVDTENVATEDEERDTDATSIRIAPPPYTRRPAQSRPAPRRAYVDFTIGWDDVWPALPAPHVKYTYNSYLNAYTCTITPEPVGVCPTSDSTADSDVEPAALELAVQLPDEDLLCAALQSLTLADIRSPSPSTLQPPPAGVSPFCPPPLPTPPPPQPATTWRLEWY
ncbi:hypothetical protein B0H15DRAFT_798949 [Mycena belliarum]|uniref:Uncharacterized protein n=1 Tax=Mycena belliarum TaxID=1033014 RepID=A0AAD6UDE0_9AGAR|nr:hypothetical protein B0H15DRAFT_798949 [Mycena belliae]